MVRDRMVSILVSFVLLSACIFGVGFIMWYYGIGNSDPPAIWNNPPTYPGAQETQVEDFGSSGKRLENGSYIRKHVSFRVSDSVDKVGAFYRGALSGAGGEEAKPGYGYPTPGPRSDFTGMQWARGPAKAVALYSVYVIASPVSSGESQVDIYCILSPGY